MARIYRDLNTGLLLVIFIVLGCGEESISNRSVGTSTSEEITIEEFKEELKNKALEGDATLEITSEEDIVELVNSSLDENSVDVADIEGQVAEIMASVPDEYAYVLPGVFVEVLRTRGVEPGEALTWLAQNMGGQTDPFVSSSMARVVKLMEEYKVPASAATQIGSSFRESVGDRASSFGDISKAIDEYTSGLQLDQQAIPSTSLSRFDIPLEGSIVIGQPEVDPVDGDGDGVPDAIDQCPGYPEVRGTWYADVDNDGLVIASTPNHCQDGIFRFAASDLSVYQLANLDDNDDSPVIAWNAAQTSEVAYGFDLNVDGDATDSDAFYVISNTQQFLGFTNDCGSGQNASCASNILIVADLDFSDLDGLHNDVTAGDSTYTTSTESDLINGDYAESTRYTGILNGGGQAIVNFNINRSSGYNAGLIASAGSGAKIIDLNFGTQDKNSGISASGSAGLVGVGYGDLVIHNVHVHGVISGYGGVGSLVGWVAAGADAEITRSSARGTVSGSIAVGGLVGSVKGPETINGVPYSSGTVTILESYNMADIVDLGQYTFFGGFGGLVGFLEGSGSAFTRSFNHGNVTTEVGQVGGITTMRLTQTATFTDVYNSGNVTSSDDTVVGGIVGGDNLSFHDRHYTNVYNIGTVASADPAKACAIEAYNDQNLPSGTDFYFLTPGSGSTCTSPGVEKTSAEMKMKSTFAGFDFSNVWQIQEDENGKSYPYLRNVTPSDAIVH